jgi:hypothetical protein
MLYLFLPIILASVFLLYNLLFSKYLVNREGLTNNNCNTNNETIIHKNNATIQLLKVSVDKLMKQVNDLVISDNNKESRIQTIEVEIKKAKDAADEAKKEANTKSEEYNPPEF